MNWEWSHTQEALDNAMDNLELIELSDLRVIYSEIKTSLRINRENESEYLTQDVNSFDENYYREFLQEASSKFENELISCIWDYMYDILRTCDSGGFNAYCCPYGCHTVSFDSVQLPSILNQENRKGDY